VPLLVAGTAILLLVIIAFIVFLFFTPGIVSNFFPGATPTAGTVTNEVAQTQGRISFIRRSADQKSRNIFVVNADGTNQQQLSNGIVIEGTAAWSPDGQRIIAQVSVNGISTVARFAVGPDNTAGDQVLLTADIKADSAFPTWSPDGKMVAFQSKRDGPLSQIYVMDADGNNKQRISDGNGFAGQPSWSPDGKFIAYAGGAQQVSGAEREIYVVPATGGTPKQVTQTGGSLITPVWSPDGKHLICLQILGERDYKILIMDTDGSNLHTLFEGGAISGPSFSPAGDKVLFYNIGDKGEAVHTVDVADGKDTSITATGSGDYYPVWSPDGTQIAWASSADKQLHKIVAAKADGSDRRIISTGEGDDYGTSWALLK
jgi:TolB protein